MTKPDVITRCYHTADATECEVGEFCFEDDAPLPFTAARVMLGSCEFPMTQYTLEEGHGREEGWNRLWYNEGIRLTADTATLTLAVRVPDRTERLHILSLPPRLNECTCTPLPAGGVRVVCHAPHGLRDDDDDCITLLGLAGGDLPLVGRRVEDAHTLVLPSLRGRCPSGDGVLYVPPLPSPRDLCERLTRAAADASPPVRFAYDADRDRVLASVDLGDAHDAHLLRFLPGPLSRVLGLSTAPFQPSRERREWPSSSTGLWGFVALPPGVYGPCLRAMCTGQPLRFSREVELAANRFYFPLLDGGEEHALLFAGSDGRPRTARILPGRYTPTALAAHVQAAMGEAAAASSDEVYAVHYARDTGRFTFSCERRSGSGGVVPTDFSLLFHHPKCVDGARFGFANHPLSSSHTYRGACVRPATLPDGDRQVDGGRNLIRLSERAAQRTFCWHAAAVPAMTGHVREAARDRLDVQTTVDDRPFAHGWRLGDVVTVAAADDAFPPFRAVVTPAPREGEDGVDLLRLRVPPGAVTGATVRLTAVLEPFNLHFGKPGSLPGHMVGFPARAVLHGEDGSVDDGAGRRLPPFEAPHSFALEHPDYVLLTFSQGLGGVQHRNDPVFTKLVLYPVFREERMIPRDLAIGGRGGAFRIRFWNPDGTPYRFHGRPFSFTLNFFRARDEP